MDQTILLETQRRRIEDHHLSQLFIFQITCCLDTGFTLGAQGLFNEVFQILRVHGAVGQE